MAYIAHKVDQFTRLGKKVEPQHNKLMWVLITGYVVGSLAVWLHDVIKLDSWVW